MKRTIPKIGLILIAVIVFPTLFFSVYEVNNLSNNQQVVDSIYSSQLASIVFSLNQYSDDVLGRWANTIDEPKILNTEKKDSLVEYFIRQNIAVKMVFFANNLKISSCYSAPNFKDSLANCQTQIAKTLEENKTEILKLVKYLATGYRKIQPIENDYENINLLLFALNEHDSTQNICGIFVDSKTFIKENLGPKVQNMAQDKFFISFFDKRDNSQFFTNELYAGNDHKIRIKENLWLFNNYAVGIQLNNDPIEQLVNKRTTTNIIMIILMDFVLLIGAWFVFRNLRKEIELAQIKSEFVSNVSHEIKTPLAVINMYSETLEMGRIATDEKKMEYYRVINKEAKRLSRMVNSILNFSKIESGKREYNFIEADLNDIIENVVANYQHHFKNSNFTYQINLTENLPFVNADEEAISDALTNLIDNSMKYSTDNKLIEINSGVLNNRVFVEVKDFGIGIKEKEQKLVFDKFYRVTQGNLAHQAKGSGIGLSIVRHIVDAHNGEIILKSTYGIGSSFTLFFHKS